MYKAVEEQVKPQQNKWEEKYFMLVCRQHWDVKLEHLHFLHHHLAVVVVHENRWLWIYEEEVEACGVVSKPALLERIGLVPYSEGSFSFFRYWFFAWLFAYEQVQKALHMLHFFWIIYNYYAVPPNGLILNCVSVISSNLMSDSQFLS